MSTLDDKDISLALALHEGLDAVPNPYEALGTKIDMEESEVISRLKTMLDNKVIKRFGVIVRHHELGYRANAMVVWDVPDDKIDDIGEKFGAEDFITLCYQRLRRLPEWPYNLFCMIHGKEKETVLSHVAELVEKYDLQEIGHEALFSLKRFKQRGAKYG